MYFMKSNVLDVIPAMSVKRHDICKDALRSIRGIWDLFFIWDSKIMVRFGEGLKKKGDRDDAQEITAFWKYIIFNRKSLSIKYF